MNPEMEPKDLDAPAFTNIVETVISYKGENFYKACGELVTGRPDEGTTSCVKRVGHPGDIHEDFDGNTTEQKKILNLHISMPIEEAVFQALGAASACWENLSGAGVFESTRCKQIGDELIAYFESKQPIY